MAEEIESEDEVFDIVTVNYESEVFSTTEEEANDSVVVSRPSQELTLIESGPTKYFDFPVSYDEVVLGLPKFNDQVVVSAVAGPPGEEGPTGPEGPIGVHVVSVQVDGSHLITSLSNGITIDAGVLPSGVADSPTQVFEFSSPQAVWVCEHNFDRRAVQVVTYDGSGDEIFGDVSYLSNQVVEIRWYSPTAGTAQITK